MILVWAGTAAVFAVAGASELRAGNRVTDRLRQTELRRITERGPLADVRAASAHFRAARARFRSPVLAPTRVLPVVGRQVRSASALASAAATATSAAEEAIVDATELLREHPGPGPERVAQVRSLGEIARRLDRRLQPLELGPKHALVAPLERARRNMAADIAQVGDGARRAAAAGDALADLLGGPRAYLVFAANNAEMRAGTGMFLSVGRLEAGAGRIRVTEMQSVTDVDVPAGVPLDGDLAARWGWLKPETDWRNLMLSPRFDASAAVAAQMWAASGRPPVDGVLVLDPVALREILEATGAVEAAGRRIGPDNVVEELVHTQYTRFPELTQRDERREGLAAVAGAVLDSIDRGGWTVERLADGLAQAVRGRHLMLWSARPTEQRGWTAAGADGAVRPDSLLFSILNRGGNKLDYWVATEADLTLKAVGDHTDGTLRLTVRNEVPAQEPSYVTGPHFGIPLAKGEYLGLAALTLPGAATGGRLEGFEHLAVAGADGPTRVVAAEFRVEPGATRTIVARFRLPGRHGTLRVEPSARVPKPTLWRFRDRTWYADHPVTVRW